MKAALVFALLVLALPVAEIAMVEASPVDPSIYEIASAATGCPVNILRGIAFAESTRSAFAIGDSGRSIGLCQLDERYHAERVALIGREYNPWFPLDSLIVTGALYMCNLSLLKTERAAIAAHMQGVSGVKKNGVADWYVDRVWSRGMV